MASAFPWKKQKYMICTLFWSNMGTLPISGESPQPHNCNSLWIFRTLTSIITFMCYSTDCALKAFSVAQTSNSTKEVEHWLMTSCLFVYLFVCLSKKPFVRQSFSFIWTSEWLIIQVDQPSRDFLPCAWVIKIAKQNTKLVKAIAILQVRLLLE